MIHLTNLFSSAMRRLRKDKINTIIKPWFICSCRTNRPIDHKPHHQLAKLPGSGSKPGEMFAL